MPEEMNIVRSDCENMSKTQVWIGNALLELMEQMDYNQITIKQLTEHAELARATFYLNYKSKDEVLSHYIDELYFKFYKQVAELENPTAYTIALSYFSFWKANLDFIRLLQKQNLFSLLLDKYEQWIQDISEMYSEEQIFHLSFSEPKKNAFFLVYQSAGLWNMLKHWVNRGAEESPEYLAALFDEITAK